MYDLQELKRGVNTIQNKQQSSFFFQRQLVVRRGELGKLRGCHSWEQHSPQSVLAGSQGDRGNALTHKKHPEEEYFPAEPHCCQSWQMNNLSDPGRHKPSLDPSPTLVSMDPCAGGGISQVPPGPPGPQALPAEASGMFCMAQIPEPSWACFMPATLTSVPAHHQQAQPLETTTFS